MPQENWIERLVRYQCLEPLIAGQRVLEVGCGTGRGANQLAQVAEQVDAIDTSSIILTQARRHYSRVNLEYQVAEPDRLVFPSHAFGVVVVPELQRWITRGGLIPELRRVLAPDGIAVFAVPSADAGFEEGLAYQDFVEYLSQGFNQVRLIGEVPFVGTIMADFEPDDELEPELDCSLIDEDEPPAAYLALCSDGPVDPIGYTVIQIPAQRERESERLEALRIELDRARQQASQAGARTEEWATKVESISAQLVARGDQLEAATVRVQQLESELALARGAGVDPDVDLVVAHKALKDERDELKRRVEEFEQFRAEIASREEASDDVGELRRRLAEAERRVLEASTRGRSEVTQVRRELREKTEEATRAREELKAVRVALDEARALLADRTRGTDGEVLASLRDELEATREELQLTVDASRARIAEYEAEARRIEEDQGGLGASDAEVAPLRRLVDNLTQQLEAERERLDEARRDVAEARAELAEERGMRLACERRAEDEHVALTEARRRAESADRRADALISRVEGGAAERVKLHERIAELQALRQSDRWRRDELLGRLRECQGRLSSQSDDGEGSEAQEKAVATDARQADERAWRSEPTQHERVGGDEGSDGEEGSPGVAGAADRGDDPIHDALRADLSRANARIAVLQRRCDELLADAQASAEATRQAQQALKRVDTATDTPVEGTPGTSSPSEGAPKRVRSASPSGEGDASSRLRALELELGRARDVATELQVTQSELRDARHLAEELATAQSDLRRRLRETSSTSSTRDAGPEVAKGETRDVSRDEVVVRYAKQVAELQKGAALHLEEVEHLGHRIEELEAFAEELRQERDGLEVKLAACESKVGAEAERAEGYRRELAAQGKKLATVEGELLRLRGAEADAT